MRVPGAIEKSHTGIHVEHRWGWRVRLDQPARIVDAQGSIDMARIRDLSTSGAFLETARRFPVFSVVDVQFLIVRRRRRVAESVAAHVVRNTVDGIGVEWCEFNPPLVARLLHEAMAMQEGVPSPVPETPGGLFRTQ